MQPQVNELPELEGPVEGGAAAAGQVPGATDSFEPGPAAAAGPNAGEPSTQIFDDGSRLYRFPDGRNASIPSADQHHQFSTQQLAQRLGLSEGEASDRLRSLSTRLGPDGDRVLAEALATGRMNVGLAGISGLGGGARSADDLESTRVELGRLSGRDVGVVLDNANGGLDARRSNPNAEQQETLRRLLDFNRDAGITTNLSVHSNGVNALSEALRQSPDARLGQVNLVDVNVSGNRATATEQLRRIVQASDRTSLVTTAYDAALGASRADSPIHTLIGAAAAAGVPHIRVLAGADHLLADVRRELERQGPSGPLDFRRDATGQTVPVSPRTWSSLRFEMRDGRLIYRP